jgi:hypothetical protein
MYSSEKRLKSNSQKNIRQNVKKEDNHVQVKLNINKIAFPNNS